MAIQTITDLPLSTDTANFDTRADQSWTQAKQAFEDINDLIPTIELAVPASESAQAAANYKGLWSSLSGALNIPASVFHDNNFWVLKVNLANVAAEEPGVSTKWETTNHLVDYQEFTSTANWNKKQGAKFVYIEAIGGGGGGANDTGGGAGSSGGSGGEFTRRLMQASDVTDSVTVTVGAGGQGRFNSSNGPGFNGGTTSFGSYLSAIGGVGGRHNASASYFTPTPRSTSSVGVISSSAGSVMFGALDFPNSGYGGIGGQKGGNSLYGGAGGGGATGAGSNSSGGSSQLAGDGGNGNASSFGQGGAGTAPGGGGGGSTQNGGGGTGGNGIVRVWSW